MKTWAIAALGVLAVGVLAVIFREEMVFGLFWVMGAVFWVIFVWLISTVISRRPKRSGGP